MTILISIFGSVNLMGLGVIGEYIGKILEESRNRPLYWLSHDSAISSDSLDSRKKSLPPKGP